VSSVKITRELHFSAAHRVFNPEWTDERNSEVFGSCANPNWHGHDYRLMVTVEGIPDPQTGFVMDLKDLKALVESKVIKDVDHRNINLEVSWMKSVIPSTENFVIEIWNRLVEGFPEGIKLSNLTLWETPRHCVEYEG
jgi:6-pyruvoyltetrahydropterin/6-carboxytetrahydropterin synthase